MGKRRQQVFIYSLLAVLILLPYLGFIFLHSWYDKKTEEIRNASFIIVSKEEMNLRLVDYKGIEKLNFPIACGKNFGNKEKIGDLKTPEGIFHITDIQNSSEWKHDFKDGNGEITGAYGPFFIRLDVPGQKGIGIHGTDRPSSIGTRDTEGCIRLRNEDLQELVKHCDIGMMVFILPSYSDVLARGRADSLKLAAQPIE